MTVHVCHCNRCGGMMAEVYGDLMSPDDMGMDVVGWRCVNCGDYVDELVLKNREMQQRTAPFPIRLAKERAPMQRSAPLSIQRRRVVA
ncbi:MAG: hypothetical protein HP491_17380 [Nitrospira sp.]|nr:hypothetical protein [Nitrospira sp.]